MPVDARDRNDQNESLNRLESMNSSHLLICMLGVSFLSENLLAQDPAAKNPAPQAAAKNEVGIASRDGITVSGTDVLVTRNGRTEKLAKELTLPNGLRVNMDGTLVAKDGSVVTLRSTQLLTFEGRVVDVPIVESVAPAKTVTIAPAATPATPALAPTTPPPATPRGHIKAGEGVQK